MVESEWPIGKMILIICSVLGVTPYELFGGTDGIGSRSKFWSIRISNTEEY